MSFRSVGVVAVSSFTTFGHACCITFADIVMNLAKETAVVIWDDEQGIQHFIRKADFEGEAKDFGFIFPSPSQPFRIEVASEDVFEKLERYGPRDDHGATGGMRAAEGSKGIVEVLEVKQVGDYKATVFRASDGAAITNWLKAQGHKLRPAMTPWFDHYAGKGWVFTALKYQARRGRTPTKALCISFKASQPFYPFKMPSDTFAPGTYRPIDLYVLSREELDPVHTGGSAWKGSRQWSARLPETATTELSSAFLDSGAPLEMPSRLMLTRYRNTAEASGFEEDIVFRSSRSYTWAWVALGLGAIGFLSWARLRRRVQPQSSQ